MVATTTPLLSLLMKGTVTLLPLGKVPRNSEATTMQAHMARCRYVQYPNQPRHCSNLKAYLRSSAHDALEVFPKNIPRSMLTYAISLIRFLTVVW